MSVRKLQRGPSSVELYARAALAAVPGASKLPFVAGGGGELPDLELELEKVAADPDRVAEYCRVCEFALRDVLPPTYPHILAFGAQMALMTDPSFPFAAIGLVHIGNRIVQRRPIGRDERLTLRVSAGDLAPHPKGRTFVIRTAARAGAEPVWEEEMTILRRGGGGGSGERRGGGGERRGLGGPEPLPDDAPRAGEWRLGGDLGRRYAAVSGDRNPIHMHSLTARAFGFPRAIAHGMWTKARCLAALEPRLAEAFAVQVAFKRPILLPAKVAFAAQPEGEPDGGPIRFAVRDARKGTPHLDGIVEPLR